nr:odorant receptor 19a [Helicoverpa armigera]
MTKPRPRHYFGFHYRILRFLGLGWWHHPEEGKTTNFPGWYLYYSIVTQVVWVAGFVGLETIDPFVGEKEMDRFMFSLSFVITHNLTLIKLYIFFFKNVDIQEIVRTLEIELYDYYQNIEKNRKTVKISKIITGSFIFFGWLTIGNGNVYGTIQDLHWKSLVATLNDTSQIPVRTLPQPIYIPWNYQKDKSYIPTFVLETVGLLWTGHIVMTIDTFIASVILHMGAQFEILNEAITTAYDRTMTSLREGIRPEDSGHQGQSDRQSSILSVEDSNERIVHAFIPKEEIDAALQTTFRNCFRQHQVLINCVEKFSRTYSYGFMTQLLSSMAAICVVMVQVSQDASSFKSVRLITSVAFFFAMITQLGMQCFTGNELTLQAERISDAVMQCKWERIPTRQRRLLLMMMMRAQRPLRLTAAGFTNMDNACFLAIMKAAYSYYAVLSQRQE